MEYSSLVDVYEKIELTTKRLEMTDLLVALLKKTPPNIVDKVVYLTQGRLYPEYIGIELGVAEKLALRAIALASGMSLEEVETEFKKAGDIGLTAERILSRRKLKSIMDFFGPSQEARRLMVEEVYDTLDKVARTTGEGSQDVKISLIASLLRRAMPKEAKYLLRTVTGKLRLGVADMTILDALAIAFCGGKDFRPSIERAYNLSSDLGYVAKVVAEKGTIGLKEFKVTIGRPIRPMLAERLTSAEEILAKLGGKCIAEYKYDGERIQAHKSRSEVVLFSRRLENITHHYPDACDLIREHIKADEAIVEAECVAIDPDTGEMRPFQELMHRRRKYGIEQAMKEYPVSLFFFDCLYIDGEELTDQPYPKRREILTKILEPDDRVALAKYKIISSVEELERFFEEAVSEGCEGLICKSLTSDSIYQAGARGWLWIKFKRSYQSKLVEPIDVTVVGAFWGRGKRAGKYGALLCAVYDPDADVFRTVCKVGSGFTDEDLEELPKMLEPYVIDHRHPRVDSRMKADVWLTPSIVIEIIGDEITLSPLHTAGLGAIKLNAGLAIRFPRFTGRWRLDKKPEDSTTVEELIQMYKMQLKKIEI
ncbi:MAG: ATP-dependent DNA ligase [Candidatus Nezhaarchaeota archaeon]|nr:ATP-dependent DNA ligase [Candidatus Nezhaarchaeota archaeon]MCX8142031.1 ATP-dependent DNA ligase [Candidatus Nezhaarchaeota archaeon]MDW8050188.1 ATP-dependent DNA ligase [Nitrososphaerota archaeon]